MMTFLDWKWDGREVPEIPELKKTARDLLNEVIKRENQHVTIGTGGFQIEKDGGIYRLSFIVTDWECDIDDFNTEEEEQCAENE